MSPTAPKPESTVTLTAPHAIPVYPARALTVTNGANLGDPLGFADEVMLDDVYAFHGAVERVRLSVRAGPDGGFVVAEDSAAGLSGATLLLDSCLTLMTPEGQTTDLLVFVELDAEGDVSNTYFMALAPLRQQIDYALVRIDRTTARHKFAQVACVSFTRGTRITLASGAMVPIEELSVGDRVLTRDDGPQPVRWIGHTTVRAVGDLAPIRISAGALNNSGDLVVSPEHRLFVYQRVDELGTGRAEVLVKVRHLVNGRDVRPIEGGFVDYFQLLFDDHQIIYAEGIAAESLLVDMRTRPVVPREVTQKMLEKMGANSRLHADFEIGEGLARRPDTTALLRRASTR